MADNPRGEELIRSSAGVVVVVTIAVLLRILARWRSKAAFAADDWLIVASLIPTYGMLVCGHFSLYALCKIVLDCADASLCG